MLRNIQVGSGQKITRTATVKDNTEVKQTLQMTKLAINEGRMDDFFKLTTFDNKDGSWKDRTLTISELDEIIAKRRAEKSDDIDFAVYQINLFSRYLKKNVHSSDNGYSAKMVLNFISGPERRDLLKIILEELETVKAEFVPGKYNNVHGAPATLLDTLDATLESKYHNMEIGN